MGLGTIIYFLSIYAECICSSLDVKHKDNALLTKVSKNKYLKIFFLIIFFLNATLDNPPWLTIIYKGYDIYSKNRKVI